MKTFHEAIDQFSFVHGDPASESAVDDLHRKFESLFSEVCTDNRSAEYLIQMIRSTDPDLIEEIKLGLLDPLRQIGGLGVSGRVVKALTHAFANGVAIGILMEKAE